MYDGGQSLSVVGIVIGIYKDFYYDMFDGRFVFLLIDMVLEVDIKGLDLIVQ